MIELQSREDRIAAAGEYVLGTLDAEDRRAVEQALPDDAELRTEVQWWEERFGLLGARLPQLAPRPMVWLNIRARTAGAPSKVTTLPAAKVPPTASNAWAWIATAASVVLGVALVIQLQKEPPEPMVVTREVPVEVPTAATSYIALLKVPDTNMNWTVSVTPDTKEIVVRASGDVPDAAKDRDAELWLITDDGPVSMGVIPKEGEVRHAYEGPEGVTAGRTLAVSLEPPGGSPTGQPTGPVVSSGVVLQAG